MWHLHTKYQIMYCVYIHTALLTPPTPVDTTAVLTALWKQSINTGLIISVRPLHLQTFCFATRLPMLSLCYLCPTNTLPMLCAISVPLIPYPCYVLSKSH